MGFLRPDLRSAAQRAKRRFCWSATLAAAEPRTAAAAVSNIGGGAPELQRERSGLSDSQLRHSSHPLFADP